MLLIPDIHINARMRDSIIDNLRAYISRHHNEQSIIFLGDYVYHFAYDRTSLLQLFRFFVELYQQGKDVYVLAGNHDWISEQFVFEEGSMLTEFLPMNDGEGKLKFITQIEECHIDGERVLFLPYNVNVSFQSSVDSTESVVPHEGILMDIQEDATLLLNSKHKGEQFSGKLNTSLCRYIDNIGNNQDVIVIHHYYLEGISFPGQRGRFSFKDVALDRRWADVPGITLLSGHIHQPFVYHNYCCLGSLWATSPLEVNQCKVIGVLRDGVLFIESFSINAYMKLDIPDDIFVNESTIMTEQHKRRDDVQNNMQSDTLWNISFGEYVECPIHNISLQLMVDRVDYKMMNTMIDETLQSSLADIQLKKQGSSLDVLTEKLSLADKNLRDGFADWKEILKLYVSQKYIDEQEEYFDILRELKLF